MRTTIDLPDSLFREAKAFAAQRGIKLKDFIATAVRSALNSRGEGGQEAPSAEQVHRQRMAAWFDDMSQNRHQSAPIAPLDRDALNDRHA